MKKQAVQTKKLMQLRPLSPSQTKTVAGGAYGAGDVDNV